MTQFYEMYSGNEIVGPLVRQISWSNNIVILKRTKTIEEKEFYLKLCISNNGLPYCHKIKAEKWGSKTVENISRAIMKLYPNLKGFDKRGLYRMVQFYETYRHNLIVSTLLTQISWTNNLIILHSTKTIEEKELNVRLCIKNNYSSRELNRQISSGYYERYLLSSGNAIGSLNITVDKTTNP